jgi:hypothetical protein
MFLALIGYVLSESKMFILFELLPLCLASARFIELLASTSSQSKKEAKSYWHLICLRDIVKPDNLRGITESGDRRTHDGAPRSTGSSFPSMLAHHDGLVI